MCGAWSTRKGIEIRPYTTYARIRGRRSVDLDWSIDVGVSGDEAGREERSTDGSGHDFASAQKAITAELDMKPVKSNVRRFPTYSHRDVGVECDIDRSLRLVDGRCRHMIPVLRREINTPCCRMRTIRILKLSEQARQVNLRRANLSVSSFRLQAAPELPGIRLGRRFHTGACHPRRMASN